MLLSKILVLGATSVLGLALAAGTPPANPDDPPPAHKAKKKEDRGPGDLRKTYDLLRRLRADGRGAGRPEERLKDWTERATKFYRNAVKASERGLERQARELGTAAHDLARAVDHVRNAASFDLDDDLPPPPESVGREGEDERTNRDLRRAHDRIIDIREGDGIESKFYFNVARDLYNAARRDAVAGRRERAGELARAAEALTHVPEHLARADDDQPEAKEKRGKPEPKEKRDRPAPPKEKRDRPAPSDAIPAPID
jgi:hypothetical protein